jgi:radical SAM superfamily enzyme YgiQ (UPF0313 family)
MSKKNIYLVQFGTGTNINLLPLAAGQLVARLKLEKELLKEYDLQEIIFKRPKNLENLISKLEDVSIIGFSCFLWNTNISLQAAEEVRKRFPEALIVAGGPSVPKDPELTEGFFQKHSSIDIICIGEGEEVFASICKYYAKAEDFGDIPGIIYRDKKNNKMHNTGPEEVLTMDKLPSAYLDGIFDSLYQKENSEFSGIIWETNRGCPYECTFCTWGNLSSRKIREKPMEQVRGEIEWIGKNKIKYIAMADANFGIRERDLELIKMLAECKKRYGAPEFISVSWVKNSSDKVLKISEILKASGIGFRVTLSLQSLKADVLKAVNRFNIKRSSYEEIKQAYHSQRLYSYTELILGLPLETYDSYISGIESSLSEYIFDQLYIYPLFLFPNTKIAALGSRKRYAIESRVIENRYTKSKESTVVKEFVEIVVGTSTMPKDKWVNSFVIGYYSLALHDDRLAFFILTYLKKFYGLKVTDIVTFSKDMVSEGRYPLLEKAFKSLEDCALDVQNKGRSHLIEPEGYSGIPFDPPDAIFLELLLDRGRFYAEFSSIVELYLKEKSISYDREELLDLFVFQKAVMAHPDGPAERQLHLKYNWCEYFSFAFHVKAKELEPTQRKLTVADPNSSGGNPDKFLKNHFDVRGIPAFNEFFDEKGKKVFPPVDIHHKMEQKKTVVTEVVA